MISCITLFRKKEDIGVEQMKELMAGDYANNCLRIPNLFSYEQNYVFLKEKGDASSEKYVSDAFTIERYETLYDYECAINSAAYQNVVKARGEFADYTETFTCLENVSIPLRTKEKCNKKISLLGRRVPEVSFENYTRDWFVVHSGCMMKMPTDVFYGYNQHLIIDRMINGEHVSHEELPFDGILELFFSEAAKVAEAFATTPEGQMTVSHRKEFMSSVDPFQVAFKVFK